MASIINATTSTGLAISPDNSGSLQLATNNGTTAVTIDTSQNVGIGTSSPSTQLHMTGSTFRIANDASNIQFYNTANSVRSGYIQFLPSGSTQINVEVNQALLFATNNAERMRITSNGDLLLATTSGNFSSGNGVILAAAGRFLGTCTNDATIAGSRLGTDGNVAAWYKSTSLVGSISVTASATAYNTSSDYRLKENIAPMTGALNKVAQLKPVTYTWKSTGEAGQGFIAHELAEIVPDAVTGEKDAVDAEGKPIHQGVDTSFLVATLTAAIQELNEKVDAQAVRIAELEGAK